MARYFDFSPVPYDPRMELVEAYNQATHEAPSVPIAPYLGLVAMRGVQEERMTLEDLVTFADRLEQPHLVAMRRAALLDHTPRGLSNPSDEMLARTAGFSMFSVLTAARELFARDRPGEMLDEIVRPQGPDDPAITEVIELLRDPDNLRTYITVLEVASSVMTLPQTRREATNPYKKAITEFANLYKGVTQENNPELWGQLMDLFGWQRQTVSERLERRILEALQAEQDPRNVNGRLHRLSTEQIRVLAHNLTRFG